MSVKQMSRVWAIPSPCRVPYPDGPRKGKLFVVTPVARLVLLALADCCNDEGKGWPSQATLANKCGAGRRTVNRVLLDAEAAGWLVVTRKYANHIQTVSDYVLSIPDFPAVPTRHTENSRCANGDIPAVPTRHTDPFTVRHPSKRDTTTTARARKAAPADLVALELPEEVLLVFSNSSELRRKAFTATVEEAKAKEGGPKRVAQALKRMAKELKSGTEPTNPVRYFEGILANLPKGAQLSPPPPALTPLQEAEDDVKRATYERDLHPVGSPERALWDEPIAKAETMLQIVMAAQAAGGPQ